MRRLFSLVCQISSFRLFKSSAILKTICFACDSIFILYNDAECNKRQRVIDGEFSTFPGLHISRHLKKAAPCFIFPRH